MAIRPLSLAESKHRYFFHLYAYVERSIRKTYGNPAENE